MKTKSKRLVTPLLCVALMFAMALTAFARYQYISSATCTATPGSGSISFTAKAVKTPAAKSVSVTATLQREVSANNWEYVDSWSASSEGTQALVNQTRSVSPGVYRVVNEYSATGPDGTDYGSLPSNPVKVS